MRSLRSPDSFGSWLFTIARNEVSSHWRKTKPAARAAQEAAWETELHSQPRGPEETVLHKERLASLSQLVRQRSEERRVGKECRSRVWPDDEKKKTNNDECESRERKI